MRRAPECAHQICDSNIVSASAHGGIRHESAQIDIARGVRTRLLPRRGTLTRQARLASEIDHSGLETLGAAQEDIFLSLLLAASIGPFVAGGGGRGGEPLGTAT